MANGLISIVVPTCNREHTLRRVAPSYCQQHLVDEIIFVEDGCDSGVAGLISELSGCYPHVFFRVTRNPRRVGAAESRNVGSRLATNDFILFCDDDEYLEPDYAAICLEKLLRYGAGAISGRRVYMREGEDFAGALARFRNGSRRTKPYNDLLCELTPGSYFTGDVAIPFSNAIIVTPKKLVAQYGFDATYAEGNGYREESDYQMNLYVNGFDNFMTADTHSVHLPPSAIRRPDGPARERRRSLDVYWSVRHTRYFYKKYWSSYARRRRVRLPETLALSLFTVFIVYRTYLRPSLLSVYVKVRAV